MNTLGCGLATAECPDMRACASHCLNNRRAHSLTHGCTPARRPWLGIVPRSIPDHLRLHRPLLDKTQYLMDLRRQGFIKGGTSDCCVMAYGDRWYDNTMVRYFDDEPVRHAIANLVVSTVAVHDGSSESVRFCKIILGIQLVSRNNQKTGDMKTFKKEIWKKEP